MLGVPDTSNYRTCCKPTLQQNPKDILQSLVPTDCSGDTLYVMKQSLTTLGTIHRCYKMHCFGCPIPWWSDLWGPLHYRSNFNKILKPTHYHTATETIKPDMNDEISFPGCILLNCVLQEETDSQGIRKPCTTVIP